MGAAIFGPHFTILIWRMLPYKDPVAQAAHNRAYYAKNRTARIANTRKIQRRHREHSNAIKLAKGCAKCGFNAHPAALDFHHRDGEEKFFELGPTLSYSLARRESEIAKCDVLCANCHRIEHAAEESP